MALWAAATCCALGIVLGGQPLYGQFHETFDDADTSWVRSQTDCVLLNSQWSQHRANEAESEARFERVEFQTGPGSQVFLTHDVPPSLVIPELIPQVRIRGSRAGVRIYVRVVLPKTPSPKGDGPMTTLLPGPRYDLAGRWQTLSFADDAESLTEKLQQEIWVLRQDFGQQVSRQGAYIDKVVINAYTGPGRSTVDIDDLKIDGMVSAEPAARMAQQDIRRDDQVAPTNQQSQDAEPRESLAVRDGSVLLVNGQPFFPRIIQCNGEPFNFLKAMGFNVLELPAPATPEQLESARKLDLWLMCPPPPSVGLKPIPFQYDRVLAWTLGNRLGGLDRDVVQQRVREIHQSDLRRGRPIYAQAISHWSDLASFVDVVGAGQQPIGTSFLASQYGEWLGMVQQAMGQSQPLWADIQTELSRSLVGQISTLTQQVPPIPLEHQQLKFLCYEAITSGSRGMRFLSRNRLDGVEPATRLRALTLQWINAELDQLEPWIVGGAMMGKLPLGNNQPSLEVTAINTSRSRLLLIQRLTHHEQYLAGDLPATSISFPDPASPFNDSAYRLGQSGLHSLASVRGVTGTQVTVDHCPQLAAVVLTQDPLVVNKLNRSYDRFAQQSILDLHLDLTQQWLAILQLIDDQLGRMGRSRTPVSAAINEAVTALRQAQQLAAQETPQLAEDYLQQADYHLATARRELVTEPLGMFQSKTSAPLTTHCSLIPLHWDLARRLKDGIWRPNGLAGGDFENLQHLLAQGWQNRTSGQQFTTQVQLSAKAAVGGDYGLQLSVAPRGSTPPLVEAAPLTIETPPVPVRAGQMVRIHGWARVPQVMGGSLEGLRITDSLGGPEMCERIPITDTWQEFTLYRGVATPGTLTVTFEMTGVGTAQIDEVTIRAIDLPLATPRQALR